ncbi:MAG TPA: alpha/beta fold hydrolase [Gemmatimonadaceae bacterium]|nr:alpha/beta fold hydrolase [Gemmatimonadaceae bacterium]
MRCTAVRAGVLGTVAALTMGAGVRAQAPLAPGAERATFFLLLGSDTLAVEHATRTAARLEGDLTNAKNGSRVRYEATLGPQGTVSRTEIWAYRTAVDTTPVQHALFRLVGDTMFVDAANGAHGMPTDAGAIVYLNPSTALLEQALLRAKALGGTTAHVPLFQSAGGRTLPLTVDWLGADSAVVSLAGTEMRIALGRGGRITGTSIPSQNARAVRVEGTRAITIEKPDYSAPPGAPYTAEDVVVHTPAGVRLAGTLTLPRVHPARGAPAVVLITGSGTEERDEALPGVVGYRPFRQIADTLGRRGIAVLRLDDRGAGGSDAGPEGATSADFADDIRGALAYLRSRPDIDGSRLGLVGHSEGGMIAPMVAASDPRLRGIVLMAGPAQSGRAILAYQQRYAADSVLHVPPARRDSALAAMRHSLDSVAAMQPWLRFFLDYDPLATARTVKTPVLLLQGATDRQVTPDQATTLANAFRAGGNRDVTVKIFPRTDHLFLPDSSGNPSGYSKLPSTRVRPEVLGSIADWLAARLGRGA